MRKLQILLILSFFSVQGFAAGCLDGSEPVKSISSDGTYFVYNCGGGSTENSSSSSSSSNTKALAGIDIENDPNIDFFKPPLKPYPTDKLYWFGRYWQIVDFNKDGYSDVIYIGTMNPNNVEVTGEDTSGLCGSDVCKGYKPLPSLYLGGANKKLTYAPELIIDNREDSGMSLGRQILVADYNNDNILDFYVADHGIGGGGHNGVRDSYFLSQSNGTWVESSETQLSHSNFVVFDHGGATGDIDNDGDMDVVITELNGKTGTALWCLMNDGTGYLNKRKCGGIFSFALELADMDGNGYLDVLLGAHEFENNAFTGIVWNDGRGNFPKHIKTSLPQHKKKWGTVPEVSVADLDKDGDLDIVYSRAGKLYVGTAIQIIENLGNKRFKDHGIFPLVEAPDDYVPVHEGNEWNDYIEAIRFRDLDKDGDIDLYLSSGSQKTNGMVLLNQGDFNFSLIKAFEAYELYEKLDDSSVIITKKVLTSLAKTKETEDSIKFESSIKKNGKVIFEGVDQFTKFEFGLPLDNSGALLVGFKDLNVLDDYKLDVRLHIKYANIDFSTTICFQYHPGPEFMAARSRFKKNDWGGLEKIMPSSKCIGK
ncbi:VCBS repeat-containing protein, partial [Candidatus Pseudothioglobus singularis]